MRVALFVTCLVDQFFPSVGEATVRLLRRLGVDVEFPEGQTCCGQPAFNTGYWNEAREVAARMLTIFEPYDYVVAPSGSCVTMVKHFYADLFRPDEKKLRQAASLGAKTYELSQFLIHVLKKEDVGARFNARVTYHDSCHGLRGLGIADEPRRLLRAVRGLELAEMESSDHCCGFGGTFAIKMADISVAIVREKVETIRRTGARYVVGLDTSCLMQIAGLLHRQKIPIRTLHLAEVLSRQA
jgi:L-lactate dehydrogenase complex protein LldE